MTFLEQDVADQAGDCADPKERPETVTGGCWSGTLLDAAVFATSPGGQADEVRLQAAFQLLRSKSPVYWVDTLGTAPFWLITRHADVMAVERRGSPFSAEPRSFLAKQTVEDRIRCLLDTPFVMRGLLQMDDPDHGAYRALAQPWFTPAALAALEPWLADRASRVVEQIAGRIEPIDFSEDVAVPFSIGGIMHIMGLPEADEAIILKLSRGLVGPDDPDRRLAHHPADALVRAGVGFRNYFEPVVADRRTCPRHDLSSVIANARIRDAALPEYELMSYYMLVATAGHDTISFCLTGGMQALLDHPDQFARLKSDPSLLDTAIEEMLRWTSPGRHIMRTATEDTVLGGQPIRAGEAVALFMNSANRDETVFEAADTFRIDRRPNPHIAFGFGRHTCVGASSPVSKCAPCSKPCCRDCNRQNSPRRSNELILPW